MRKLLQSQIESLRTHTNRRTRPQSRSGSDVFETQAHKPNRRAAELSVQLVVRAHVARTRDDTTRVNRRREPALRQRREGRMNRNFTQIEIFHGHVIA